MADELTPDEISRYKAMITETMAKAYDSRQSLPGTSLIAPQEKPWEQRMANFVQGTALPMAGLLGGSALGAVGGPAGMAAGAGLGYGAANAVTRAGQGIADYLVPTPGATTRASADLRQGPQSVLGQAGQVAGDVATGAAMEMGGQILPAGLLAAGQGARSALGLGRYGPADAKFRAAAERLGMPTTAGAASGSVPVSKLESFPTLFPIGAQTAVPSFERVRAGARLAAERLAESSGPSRSLEAAGLSIQRDVQDLTISQARAITGVVDDALEGIGASRMGKMGLGGSVKEALGKVSTAKREAASEVYDEAIRLGGNTAIPFTRTAQIAQVQEGMASQLRGLGTQGSIGKAAGTVNRLTEPPPITPSGLPQEAVEELVRGGNAGRLASGGAIDPHELPAAFIAKYGLDTGRPVPLPLAVKLQQILRELARNTTSDTARGGFRALSDAISEDIGAVGVNAPGDLGRALMTASANYRTTVAADFATGAVAREAMESRPGDLARRIISGRDTDLMESIGRLLPARQQAEVRRTIVEELKGASLDLNTGQVDATRFLQNLNRFGDENLRLVMGPDMRAIDQLRETLIKTAWPGSTSNRLFGHVLKGAPERLVNELTSGKVRSIEDFDTVWNTVGATTKNEIRGSAIEQVVRESFDTKTFDFSMERFMTAKAKVPQDIWDRLLTQDQRATLRDITTVFSRNIAFARAAANPSGTGQTIGTSVQFLGGLGLAGNTVFGNESPNSFATKLAALLSPALLGKGIFSSAGQRFLTSGPRRMPNPMGGGTMTGRFGIAGALLGPQE